MLQKMSEAEMEIMELVWKMTVPCTSADIQRELPTDKNWKPTTLLTFLSRLVEKGLLSAEKQGKQNLYRPLVTREDYLAAETRSFLDELHGGSLRSFIAALSNGEKLSEDEIGELRRWLESQ